MNDHPLPGYWQFAWMVFMQPISLREHLQARDPSSRWFARSFTEAFRAPHDAELTRRELFLLGILTPGFTLVLCLGFAGLGFDTHWPATGIGLVCGILLGLLIGRITGWLFDAWGWTSAITSGVLLGCVLGVASAVAFGQTGGPSTLIQLPFWMIVGAGSGAVIGLVVGLSGSSATGIVRGLPVERTRVIGLTFVLSLSIGALASVAGTVSQGKAVGYAILVSLPMVLLRLPLWPIEAVLQVAFTLRDRLTGSSSLQASPVFWHELSYLPLPGLGRQIESTAGQDPSLARRALRACSVSPGQRDIGRQTLARLQGEELIEIAEAGLFRTFVIAETEWLPPDEGADPVIVQFRGIARYLVAAEGSSFPQHRLGHLDRASRGLDGAEVQLLQRRSTLATALRGALPAWRHAIDARRRAAEVEAEGLLPIPFRAGEPLDPERGLELFRGREASIRAIEQHLALADDARSVLLLGPRRTGKTSLLKMLPTLLPDATCIFFDLQGHPVDTPAGFFRALADETRRQARQSSQLDLPPLDDGPPFESAATWIQALEDQLGDRRLLICLDEFEVLEQSFGGDRDDLLRLMGLIRSTIQHRRRVRLLIAGEAPFDELDSLWDAHFVSVREVRLGHLDPQIARELVRRPTDDFPDDAIPDDVAAELVERTGAQPFLVQLFAQILVTQLNDAGRSEACLDDLDAVEEEAMTQVGPYFRDLWNRAPDDARPLLEALARGDDAPPIGKRARRWLLRRCLIDPQDRLTMPVFGRFLVEEVLD